MIHALPATVGAINLAATDAERKLPLSDILLEGQSSQAPEART
jgi:hypothetical protein